MHGVLPWCTPKVIFPDMSANFQPMFMIVLVGHLHSFAGCKSCSGSGWRLTQMSGDCSRSAPRFTTFVKDTYCGLQVGILGKLPMLRTLRLSPSSRIRDLNLPHYLQDNFALEELQIEVAENTPSSHLEQELNGPLPFKLRNLIVSGRGVKSLGNNFLQGVRNPDLQLTIFNTSIEKVSRSMWEQAQHIRTLKLDVRHNFMKTLQNPNTASQPGVARKIFLMDLKIAGNRWNCDCDMGWIEGWERKRRQYFCTETWDSCRSINDDLRVARCDNRKSMLDVLKNDIECGWNSAAGLIPSTVVAFASFLAITLTWAF